MTSKQPVKSQLQCPHCGEAHYISDCPVVYTTRSCINCVFFYKRNLNKGVYE